MEAINSAQFFEGHYEIQEEDLMSLVEETIEEAYLGDYDEPSNFFKGAIYGFFFCLPFWISLFWLIS